MHNALNQTGYVCSYGRPDVRLPQDQRWGVIIAAALTGTWLVLSSASRLIHLPRASITHSWLHWNWLYWNFCPLSAPCVLVLVLLFIRRRNQSQPRQTSYLAVFSAFAFILSPPIPQIAFRLAGLPLMIPIYLPIYAPLIALATGIAAAIQIRRHPWTLSGLPFALTGIIGGALWLIAVIVLYVAFVVCMSGWH